MPSTADGTASSLADQAGHLADLDKLAKDFGRSLTGALDASTTSGKQLSGVLGNVADTLTNALGRSAASALQSSLSSGVRSAAQTLASAASTASFGGDPTPFARGGIVAGGLVTPFAAGGVVASPTYFPLGRGLGLMGEAGSEAVMPLARGSDGRLGVQSSGGPATHVTVNVQATDVDSFKRSEAQVSAALARAVARGKRAL